jgi:hypothetical protein
MKYLKFKEQIISWILHYSKELQLDRKQIIEVLESIIEDLTAHNV